MSTRFSILGDKLEGFQPDLYESLVYAADGRRCEHEVIAALAELGVPVRSIAGLRDVDLATLQGAVEREAARVAGLHAAEKKERAEYLASSERAESAFDKARRAYDKEIVPKRRALAEQIAALAGESAELADFVEAANSLAEQAMPESADERAARREAHNARELATKPLSPVYPNEHADRVGSLIPNALQLINIVTSERRRKLAAEDERILAALRRKGMTV